MGDHSVYVLGLAWVQKYKGLYQCISGKPDDSGHTQAIQPWALAR